MEQSYQLHDDQQMMSSRSCDEFTYNWLNNVETSDSLITPRSNPQTNYRTEQYQYPVALDKISSYLCNSIGQLQGSYEVDVADGVETVNVFLVETQIGEQQYATVRWIHGGRKRFPDKYIFEDLTQFTLRSKDGVTEAVMVKGKNIQVSVEWTNGRGGVLVILSSTWPVLILWIQAVVDVPLVAPYLLLAAVLWDGTINPQWVTLVLSGWSIYAQSF